VKPNRQAVIDLINRRVRRSLIARGVIKNPAKRQPRFKFTWTYGNLGGIVYADDRSMARALIKFELKIPKKKRLPIEVEITREPNDEDLFECPGESQDSDNRRDEACTDV
jgi:hypothetical protein